MKNNKYFVLAILSLSIIFAFSLWFSANAIIPQLNEILDLPRAGLGLLSIILIIGFVIGGLVSTIFNLSDVFKTKHIFVASAILAAIANASAILVPSYEAILLFRFLTGFYLAGVYPTSMKIITTWFKTSRGLAIGILLGGLTLGSGLPYIFNLTGIPDWRILLSLSSIAAVVSAIIVGLLVKEGPYSAGTAKFKLSNIKKIVKNKAMRYATYGYFGHMWELYAMWIWAPLFLKAAYEILKAGFELV